MGAHATRTCPSEREGVIHVNMLKPETRAKRRKAAASIGRFDSVGAPDQALDRAMHAAIPPLADRERARRLERKNAEPRRANELLRKGSAPFCPG